MLTLISEVGVGTYTKLIVIEINVLVYVNFVRSHPIPIGLFCSGIRVQRN